MIDSSPIIRFSSRPNGRWWPMELAGLSLVVLGALVALGWLTGTTELVQILPQWVAMQFNAAIGLALCGLMILGLERQWKRFTPLVSASIAVLGFLTLSQYLFGIDLRIDELVMKHDLTVGTSHPGRMAPNSALCMLLTGSCGLVLSLRLKDEPQELAGQLFGLMTAVLAVSALLGYVLGTEQVYGWRSLTRMAPHTAAGFTIAAVALIAQASSRSGQTISSLPLFCVGGLFALLLLVDIQMPAGVAIGVAYVPLIFCSLWFKRRHSALVFAGLATLLILLGYLASPEWYEAGRTALINRALAIGAIWVTAITLYMYQRVVDRLSSSREQLELALEGGRLGLWDWNVPTSRVEYSRRWCRMVGYEPHELAPDFSTWERLVHPDDFHDAQKRAIDYVAGRIPEYISEFRMRHKQGEWRWIQSRGEIVETDEQGNPIRVAGTHLDVTREKEKDKQLRLLQLAVDRSDSMVMITSPDRADPRVVYASQAAVQRFGGGQEELIGRRPWFLDTLSNTVASETAASIRDALAHEVPFEGEIAFRARGGERNHIRLYVFPIRTTDGRLLQFGSIAYDVTKEHEAELALRQEQERFRSAMEFSPIGIALVAPDGTWLNVNPAICRIVGYSERELLATDFQSITHPDDLDLDLSYLQQLVAGEIDTYAMEKRYIHKEGHIVWVLLNVSLVRNPDGTPRHFISQIQDITKRKEHEAELQRYTQELERSNRQLDEFAYIASHDLKEPLRAIGNHSQSLIKHYGDTLDERGVHKLERLGKLTERMQKLIGDLLYFSRIGRASESMQPIDTSGLVAEQIDVLASVLHQRGARVDVEEPLPPIIGDASRISTVFRNLIVNGIKYNDRDEPRIRIRAEAPVPGTSDEKVTFHVEDNGIGIEPEFFDDVFKMFKRLHGDKVYGEGTGAGLTFVKRIVEQAGGEIWLSSEAGKGSTFHFTLPGAPNDGTP